MPSHGVARTSTWELSEEEPLAEDGHVKVVQTPFARGFVVMSTVDSLKGSRTNVNPKSQNAQWA